MRHSASALFLVPFALQAVACAPDDAEIKGSWHVWLAANSSNTVDNEDIDQRRVGLGGIGGLHARPYRSERIGAEGWKQTPSSD